MGEKLFLGKVSMKYKEYNSFVQGENIYLDKHSWDCGWYWGFGYVGNRNLHTHFNSTFLQGLSDVSEIFESTKIKQHDWWIIRDLFVQAYALKDCAAVYRHGGYQTSSKGITDIICNVEMANRCNADLEIVLDKIWNYLEKCLKSEE
jgi:hypothetical protein